MARPKNKAAVDICADCGTLEPGWASVNRGILLCDECCSIHRSLGRHISHIKSLYKGMWNMHQLNMVHTLNDNGANSIWEHSLLDPSSLKIGRRKPQPKDPLHPTKAEFIKAKHQQLVFVLRPSKEEFCTEEELSKQLHSSVRTVNLETSLRLLAQGACPNYFYKEKGTTPLHVAARAGQALQIELLIANGGNPSIIDCNGQIPAEIAKAAGHLDLSERIIECMYDVTDRLTQYVCLQKPDHRLDEHLIIPDWSSLLEGALDRTDSTYDARKKLQMLPNNLLEELAMDVYDEVDRRETETVWFTVASLPERCTVPFLPVNPQLSSTRNQGRQKLARFAPKEFTTLIVDLLVEAGCRHMKAYNAKLQGCQDKLGKHVSQISDDEPLYDTVASDDDYAQTSIDNANSSEPKSGTKEANDTITKDLPSVIEVLKKQLTLSEIMVRDLQNEIRSLKSTVQYLTQENEELKCVIQTTNSMDETLNGHAGPEPETILDKSNVPRINQRPVSMYETREGIRKPSSWNVTMSQPKRDTEIISRLNTQSLWECGASSLPSSEDVTRRTEQVTKRIQELWMAMQDPSHREAFVPCAKKIRIAVAELTSIFPQSPTEENIKSALRQLNGNIGRLQTECSGLERCNGDNEQIKCCLQQVQSCAYDIAKATKLLVTQFQIS
ncbi:ARF GTPase-activating protein GIT1 [Prorops nasuta]|uniref:ARF GTPase-activating protein GIT1 n=1 Tax=Prorops nasuta TaxID=863751 RepID=UPI0034CE6D86